jgi:hypothetical protein
MMASKYNLSSREITMKIIAACARKICARGRLGGKKIFEMVKKLLFTDRSDAFSHPKSQVQGGGQDEGATTASALLGKKSTPAESAGKLCIISLAIAEGLGAEILLAMAGGLVTRRIQRSARFIGESANFRYKTCAKRYGKRSKSMPLHVGAHIQPCAGVVA